MSKPKLRFPEFTGDWEQHKLGNICKTYSGGTPKSGKSSYYDNGTIPFIRSGEIHNDRTELYITEDGMNESSAKMVDIGDILYALYGATSGEVDISKINGAINQAILCIKPTTSFDRKFTVEILRHNKESILRTYLQGGQGNLSAQIIQSQIFNFPCLAEQQKIASLFTEIDTLIQSAEKELEGYRELKQGMLQKMFPKKGEKVPEIRFPGFTGDWEQHKVGDYYEFKNGLNKGKEFFGEGTPIVNFTDVFHNRGISPEMLSGKVRLKLSEIKNYEVKKGDIFFTRTSETIEEIGYPSVMLGEPENTVFSGFVLRGRCFLKDDPLDNLFKKYIFFTNAFRTEMLRKSSMTTRALTSGTAIKNMEFLHPSSKEEQHKIGELLTNLDNLINLQQKEIDGYKELKKGLLQQMFC